MGEVLNAYEADVLPFIRPFTEELVASVDLRTTQRVLDHGSGTGEVIVQLRRAGLDASVLAVEPNETMARRLRQVVPYESGSAETFEGFLVDYVTEHPGERFDLITSQLVLSFVDDPLGEL